MKIEQEPKFQPITLTIESKREAEMILQAVTEYPAKGPVEIAFYREIAGWFRVRAQM
jgi:hypothetical protein